CDWLQDSDTTHRLALRCARLKRPRRCRAAYQPNEIAPSHCGPRGFGQGIVAVQLEAVKGCPMSALGSKAAIGRSRRQIRFGLKSGSVAQAAWCQARTLSICDQPRNRSDL